MGPTGYNEKQCTFDSHAASVVGLRPLESRHLNRTLTRPVILRQDSGVDKKCRAALWTLQEMIEKCALGGIVCGHESFCRYRFNDHFLANISVGFLSI